MQLYRRVLSVPNVLIGAGIRHDPTHDLDEPSGSTNTRSLRPERLRPPC